MEGFLSCRKVGTYRVVSTSGVVCVSLDTVSRLQVIIANVFSSRLVVMSKVLGVA